ncbi:MAG: hypothetical protein ABII68_04675 [Pseudomonadota bacterium]
MTKDGREIDFFITRNDAPFLMAEVKWADSSLGSNFSIFDKYFPGVKKVQVVGKLDREKTYPDGTEIRSAHHWLGNLTLI